MFGSMAESTRGHGETIRCTVEEFSFGRTVENTKGSTSTIRNKDMVNSAGLMEDHTKDSGKMGSKMARAHTATKKAYRRMESGLTERK